MDHFYVHLRIENGRIIEHRISAKPDAELDSSDKNSDQETDDRSSSDEQHLSSGFRAISDSLYNSITFYKEIIPIIMATNPFTNPHIKETIVTSYLRNNGILIDEADDYKIYRMDIHHIQRFIRRHDILVASFRASRYIPRILLIGLISSVDAIMRKIIYEICMSVPQSVFSSDKKVPYSDIVSLGGIDELKNYIIESEVDAICRSSISEQVAWIERNVNMNIIANYSGWPDLV